MQLVPDSSQTATISFTQIPATTGITLSSTPESGKLPTTSPTKELVSTSSPALTSIVKNLDFKFAYLAVKPGSEGKLNASIILMKPPYTQRSLIYQFGPDIGWGSDISWSHDGSKLAFVQITKGRYVITTIEVGTQETNEVKLPENFNSSEHGIAAPLEWSKDDRWLAVTLYSGNFAILNSLLVAPATRQIVDLGQGIEFCAWSESHLDQYLYIHHGLQQQTPESQGAEDIVLYIGQVGIQRPLFTIHDIDKDYQPRRGMDVTLRPGSDLAIITSHETNIYTHVSSIDLNNGAWHKLSLTMQGIGGFLEWSPDGRWLVMIEGRNTYLWETARDDQDSLVLIPPLRQFAIPRGWTRDSKYLWVQDESLLYAVDTANPQAPVSTLDLEALGIMGSPLPLVELWFPDN